MRTRLAALACVGTLAALPAFAQDVSGVRQVNGTGIYCRVIGQGEPLVVVHGGPGLAHDYLFTPFSRLAADYRLVFYDQRGSGRSDAFKPGEKVTVEDLVDDLEALRQALGLESFNLVGQSWGAIIAIRYTARHPRHVRRLLLLEPAPGSSDALPEFQRRMAARRSQQDKDELLALSANPALRTDPALFKTWMNLSFKSYYFDAGKQDLEKLAYMDAERIQKFFASSTMFGPYIATFSLYDTMAGITCPVLIVHGADDVVPTASVERMKAAMPKAELHVIGECGHFVHVEKPNEYFRLIRTFLGAR